MRRFSLLLLIVAILSAPFLWKHRSQLTSYFQRDGASQPNQPTHTPDPARYETLKKQLANQRQQLAQKYQKARTHNEKEALLAQARTLLESHLLEMTHCWLGTPWDFNGTCQTPGSGKIACGYFVSTIMRDAGFHVERTRLGQQASQNIIATFLPRDRMHVRAGIDYDTFIRQETSRGPGWCIVGLDRHVAFLVIEPSGSIRFIHASPGPSKTVVDETKEQADILRSSRYRVTGNITANKQCIHGWLTGKQWKTKTGR